MKWPITSKKNVILGNKKSHIAICTLWSEKETVAKDISNNLYQIIGNLYSAKGINYVIRNTLSNPTIKYLIILGKDLSGSGEKLIKLSNNYNEESNEFNFLDLEKKHITLFNKQVKIFDLRKKSKYEIIEKLKELNKIKFKITTEPIIIEEKINTIEKLPSENSNFIVREDQIKDAYLKILDLILKFGETKETQYDTKEKEIINTIAIITNKDQEFKNSLNISEEKLKNYLPTIMSKEKPDEVVYTYGSRLFSYDVEEYNQVDQIQNIINLLNKTKHSRRAVAITWNVKKDHKSDHPPCLVYQHFLVRENKLYLTTVFRSNDMFKAFPLNALALNELLNYVCQNTNLEYGNLTIISNSAHIYEPDFNEAKKLIEKHHKKITFVNDERGYFIISTDQENILVKHYTNNDNETGMNFKGKSAREIQLKILSQNLISRLDHASYLGTELTKAEYCLKYNKKYTQDKEI